MSWPLTAVPGVPAELTLTHWLAWPVPDTAECRVLGILNFVPVCFWAGAGHSWSLGWWWLPVGGGVLTWQSAGCLCPGTGLQVCGAGPGAAESRSLGILGLVFMHGCVSLSSGSSSGQSCVQGCLWAQKVLWPAVSWRLCLCPHQTGCLTWGVPVLVPVGQWVRVGWSWG